MITWRLPRLLHRRSIFMIRWRCSAPRSRRSPRGPLCRATSDSLPPSLIHHVRVGRVVDRGGHSPGRANRGRRAKNAGVATGRAAAAACRWRKNASSITATPGLARGDGVLARSRAGPSRRAKNEPTPPIRRSRDPPGFRVASAPPRARFSRDRGLTPRKAATAPVIGM